MQSHGLVSISWSVVAAAIFLGLAPMAPIQTAVSEYVYSEGMDWSDPQGSPYGESQADASINWAYCDVWAWAYGEAEVQILGAGSSHHESTADAWAWVYFFWGWYGAGTATGGYFDYDWECSATMDLTQETALNDFAEWATAYTGVDCSFQNWLEPGGPQYSFLGGTGSAHELDWYGPPDMTISSDDWWFWFYNALGYGNREIAEWNVVVDDEGPIVEGVEVVFLQLYVDLGVHAEADVYSSIPAGAAKANAYSWALASANGYAEFFR